MKKNNIIVIISVIIVIVLITILLVMKDTWFPEKGKNEIIKKDEFNYTPILYEICDDDNCNYLMAAVHLGDENVGKLSNIVNEAYNKSDYVAAELDTSDITADLNEFMLPDGQTLDTILPSELKEKIENFSNEHPLFSYNSLKIYRLGLIYSVLDLLPFLENGYINSGTDSIIVDRAHKDNKEVIALEEYEDQMSIFMNSSDELYIKEIETIIDNYEELNKLSIEMYEAYINADIEKLKELVLLEGTTEEKTAFNDALLDNRNTIMVGKIKQFLEEDKNVFVTVGAAHVIGDNGIINLMSKENYKIKLLK